MPHIDISTNASVAPKVGQKLLGDVVSLTETLLGKPKNVTMARISGDALMSFQGTPAPAAFVRVAAIGLPTLEARNALTSGIAALLDEVLAVPVARTFVVFTDVPRDQWGVNGAVLS